MDPRKRRWWFARAIPRWQGDDLGGWNAIPAIVWRSSRIIPKRTLTGISSIMDILPTCAAWAGASLPEDRTIDGHDLTDYIEGRSQNSPRSEYFFYLRTGLLGVRQGKWKLHLLREKDPEWLSPFRPSQHVEPEDAGAIKGRFCSTSMRTMLKSSIVPAIILIL